jgi:lipopolysaccharide biosynthesis protein
MRARAKAALRRLRVQPPSPVPVPVPVPLPAPADFSAWLRRRSLRPLRVDLDQEASIGVSQPGTQVVIVMHACCAATLADLDSVLAAIPVEHDLLITNSSGAALNLPDLPDLTRRVDVYRFLDHGGDVLPLVQLVNADLLDPYALVLRLRGHPWCQPGEDSTDSAPAGHHESIHAVAGSRESVSMILDAFADDPELGLAAAPNRLLGPESWGASQSTARQLLRRIQLSLRGPDLVFPAGSAYWVRAFVLQGLRSLQLTPEDFETEPSQVGGAATHRAIDRLIGYLATEAGYCQATSDELVERTGAGLAAFGAGADRKPKARVFPYYLPQFHPFVENDEWWGRGFTEWTNVTASQPVFRGHKQPLLPSEFGFYDLRIPGIIEAQYEVARRYGVEGFMLYHYWFAGKQLMTTPVDTIAADERTGPFCLMWANENWTRTWDGGDTNILIQQEYETISAATFIDDVMHLLSHPRYVRVDGKPLLAVYRPGQMADFDKVLDLWRQKVETAGLPGLVVLNVDMPRHYDGLQVPAKELGLDGTMGFPPHNHKRQPRKRRGLRVDARFRGRLESYRAMANDAIGRVRARAHEDRYYPCVLVNFDNTARRQWTGTVLYGANPYTFRRWLCAAVDAVSDRAEDDRVVFINAWNEWAEAAVLEPSAPFGRTYLQAVRSVVWG